MRSFPFFPLVQASDSYLETLKGHAFSLNFFVLQAAATIQSNYWNFTQTLYKKKLLVLLLLLLLPFSRAWWGGEGREFWWSLSKGRRERKMLLLLSLSPSLLFFL